MTYGFRYDLTRRLAREGCIGIDASGFVAGTERQRAVVAGRLGRAEFPPRASGTS